MLTKQARISGSHMADCSKSQWSIIGEFCIMQRMSKKFARGANLLFLGKVTVVRMHHG